MLLVVVRGFRRAFSTTPAASIDPAALRKANRHPEVNELRGKLEKLSRPFNALVAPYYPERNIHGVNSTTKEGLAFGLQAEDLSTVHAKTPLMEKLLSINMSSQAELRKQRVHQAMELFCRGVNDTGSPEVQAAVWSVKIASLENHVRQYKHDYVTERKIVEFKDQRRKILRYLKRISLERYFDCLDRIGLPHNLVEAATSKFPLPKIKWPKTPEGLRKLRERGKK